MHHAVHVLYCNHRTQLDYSTRTIHAKRQGRFDTFKLLYKLATELRFTGITHDVRMTTDDRGPHLELPTLKAEGGDACQRTFLKRWIEINDFADARGFAFRLHRSRKNEDHVVKEMRCCWDGCPYRVDLLVYPAPDSEDPDLAEAKLRVQGDGALTKPHSHPTGPEYLTPETSDLVRIAQQQLRARLPLEGYHVPPMLTDSSLGGLNASLADWAQNRGFQFMPPAVNGRKKLKSDDNKSGPRYVKWRCAWGSDSDHPCGYYAIGREREEGIWETSKLQKCDKGNHNHKLFADPEHGEGGGNDLDQRAEHAGYTPDEMDVLAMQYIYAQKDDPSTSPEYLPRMASFDSDLLLEKYIQDFSKTYKDPRDGLNFYFAWVRTSHKPESSTNGPGKTTDRIVFSCHKHKPKGEYANGMGEGCPVRVVGFRDTKGKWHLRHLETTYYLSSGGHNHEPEDMQEAITRHRRLDQETRKKVMRQSDNGQDPKSIILDLMDNGIQGLTNSEMSTIIYQERKKLHLDSTLTHMLLSMFQAEGKWDVMVKTKKVDGRLEFTTLGFAHCESLQFAKLYPGVVMIDCTYKTNYSDRQTFQIVGRDPCGGTFSIGFVFMHGQSKENFDEVFKWLKQVYVRNDIPFPKVIVTDRDLAAIASIKEQFPLNPADGGLGTRIVLCRWHVEQCVKGKAHGLHIEKEKIDEVLRDWKTVIASSTVSEYTTRLPAFYDRYNDGPGGKFTILMDYIRVTWVTPHAEKLIDAYVHSGSHRNYLNTTTSAIEGMHSKMKGYIGGRHKSIPAAILRIMSALKVQQLTLKRLQAKDKRHDHSFDRWRTNLLKNVYGKVSRLALAHILLQLDEHSCNGSTPQLRDWKAVLLTREQNPEVYPGYAEDYPDYSEQDSSEDPSDDFDANCERIIHSSLNHVSVPDEEEVDPDNDSFADINDMAYSSGQSFNNMRLPQWDTWEEHREDCMSYKCLGLPCAWDLRKMREEGRDLEMEDIDKQWWLISRPDMFSFGSDIVVEMNITDEKGSRLLTPDDWKELHAPPRNHLKRNMTRERTYAEHQEAAAKEREKAQRAQAARTSSRTKSNKRRPSNRVGKPKTRKVANTRRTYTCQNCGKNGHNIKTCKAPEVKRRPKCKKCGQRGHYEPTCGRPRKS